jgi:beta-glucosidase
MRPLSAILSVCALAASVAVVEAATAPRAPMPTAARLDLGRQTAMPLYKDPGAPIPARVNDLVKRMTLEEKVAQITTVWERKPDIEDSSLQFDTAKASKNFPNGIGGMARPSDRRGAPPGAPPGYRGVRETIAFVNAAQHWAVEQTRLGIPIWFHEEALHGYATENATSFPQAIAQASTWDPDLIRRIDTVVAREVRARGVMQVLSPVVDVARDPRWGRIEETFGEDPYLVGEMGVAAVQGLQGDSLPLAPGHVFATLKHMTGHGQPESGTNVGPALYGERTIRDYFLPPFEQAVKRTNIRAVMASYNEIDGIPSHANTWLLQRVLRGEWGYQGAVVSDYYGIEQLAELHHVEPDQASAAIRALRAGVDVDLPDGASFGTLADSVHSGRVSVNEIDTAVRRFLTLKFEAGLFEHPYADADAAVAITENDEAHALAAEAARKAVILLKNDGTLPLAADKVKTLAVIGPNAASVHLGGYSGHPVHTVSILDGIKAKLGSRVNVVYSEGVRITESSDWDQDNVQLSDPTENTKRISDAVQVAKGADAIVLVIGGNEETSREAWANNHLGDRDSLDLVGQQNDLANAMFALGKPVVVVLINGRPLSVVNVAEHADALVEGWYLGEETGTAMADILFGDANPGGHLPVTIPRSVGQLPMYYDYKPSAHRGYLFDTTAPLFPFGYGLSYTSFDIGAPRLSRSTMKPSDSVQVSVDVRNTGARAGDEVVQLYIHDLVASSTRPVKELKGFRRVTLQPGESRTVTFALTPESLRFWNADMKRVVEPGTFDIMAGANSADVKHATLTVTP